MSTIETKLRVKATSELDEQVKKELKEDDPQKKKAKASIENNVK